MSQMAMTSPRFAAWSMSLSPFPPTPMPAIRSVSFGFRLSRAAEVAEAVKKYPSPAAPAPRKVRRFKSGCIDGVPLEDGYGPGWRIAASEARGNLPAAPHQPGRGRPSIRPRALGAEAIVAPDLLNRERPIVERDLVHLADE